MIALIGVLGGGEITIVVVFFIIGLFFIFRKNKTKEDKIVEKEEKLKKLEEFMNNFKAKYETGLPIANGSESEISYKEECFEIKGAGNTITLSFDKITDICIKTDTEIQKQYVSSVGGAVAGAALFGPLGAIVVGRVKEKKDKTITQYSTYLKNGEIDCISFDVTEEYYKASEMIKKFNSNKRVLYG